MDFLKKNRTGIVVIIYLALVGLLFYFFVIPFQGKIESKASDIQQEKIDQDITKKKIVTVPVMEKDYQKYKENEENLGVIMDQSQEVEFIKELEGLAEETNNKIEFKIQDDKKPAPAKGKNAVVDIKSKLAYTNFLSMQIALDGDYAGFLNFLHKLENYGDYVNIISISSQKISKETGVRQQSTAETVPGGNNSQSTVDVPASSLNSVIDMVVYIKK